MKELLKNKRTRYIVAAVHMLAAILWQGKIFKNVGVNPSGTKVLDSSISDSFERIVTRGFSFLFAFLIIWFFWKLVFKVISEFKKSYMGFIALFIVGAVFLGLLWPDILTFTSPYYDDNVVTYSCAVRLTPDYWHNFYHSVIYCAALLFFPMDSMIMLFQWALYVFALAYVFERASALNLKRKWLIFLAFLLPDNIMLMGYSHRIMIYISLVTVYAAIIVFDLLEHRERDLRFDILLAVFGAFLCVYRSEGIIPGVLLYGIYMLFQGKRKLPRILTGIGIFAVLFLIINLPQKMGTIRYYGDDYSLVNAMSPLQVIINSSEGHIDSKYWDDINGVVPSWAIAQYGVDGFRRYNSAVAGNPDLDQSSAGEKSKAFLSAYRKIVMDNKKLYLEFVWDKFILTTLGRHAVLFEGYTGEDHELPGWSYPGWDNGRADLFENHHTAVWAEFTKKFGLFEKVKKTSDEWTHFWHSHKLYLCGLIFLVAADFALFIASIFVTVKKKDKTYIGLGFTALTMVVLFIAVAAVMPEAWSIYLMLPARLMEFVLLFACCFPVASQMVE